MKINLEPTRRDILANLSKTSPEIENIKLDGVEYNLRYELSQLRKLAKIISSSENKGLEVSRVTHQNLVSLIDSYLLPCLNRIKVLERKDPTDINSQITGFKTEVDSAKDFYLENLKLKLEIENIENQANLLQEKTEEKTTKETIIEAQDLLIKTTEYYKDKEDRTFRILAISLFIIGIIVLIDFIRPQWLCFCIYNFCFDPTISTTDKWMFVQHLTSKLTFIIIAGYWIKILARNYQLYSNLHIKNRSRNDVSNILLRQGEMLQRSGLITSTTKEKVMESILSIDESKIEQDIGIDELEKLSKIASNFK